MNTFVPELTFDECARALDNKRLNKQVSECGQILRVLDKWPNCAWSRHPAVLMWIGYDETLHAYMQACEKERLRRGMNPHAEAANFPWWDDTFTELPPWWGGPIHDSHKLVLKAKLAGLDHSEYKHLYHWPVRIHDDEQI